jgi:hypothetical protein
VKFPPFKEQHARPETVKLPRLRAPSGPGYVLDTTAADGLCRGTAAGQCDSLTRRGRSVSQTTRGVMPVVNARRSEGVHSHVHYWRDASNVIGCLCCRSP